MLVIQLNVLQLGTNDPASRHLDSPSIFYRVLFFARDGLAREWISFAIKSSFVWHGAKKNFKRIAQSNF